MVMTPLVSICWYKEPRVDRLQGQQADNAARALSFGLLRQGL